MMEETIVLKRYESFVLGVCKCGCGKEISNLRNSRCKLSLFLKGHRQKGYTRSNAKRGPEHHSWMGGTYKTENNYIMSYCPEHPRSKSNRGYVQEHILVMEAKLGRYLIKGEEVHHINENTLDNRIENLKLVTRAEHMKIHRQGKPNLWSLGKHKDTSDRICFNCKSNTTYIRYPSKSNKEKTPCPVWCHLPWDKENWYCMKCYNYLVRIKK